MGGRRAFLRDAFGGAISTAFLSACKKKRVEPPPPLVWFDDVDLALAEARRIDRAALLYFCASWDCASKELEHATFPDPEVAALLFERFVCVRVDCSDDEDKTTEQLARRFDIKGIPTLIATHPKSGNELWRASEYTKPEKLTAALREALARHAVVQDVEKALRLGASWRRPVVLFFGPSWDEASEVMRRTCLTDWAVASRLRESFVFTDVRKDEGWSQDWVRFGVRELPSVIVMDGRRRIELARTSRNVDPPAFQQFLDVALARHRA